MNEKEILRDKIMAMFLLIACGDALGMPIETMTKSQIEEKYGRINDYIRPDGHKWFDGREKGTWTDDWFFTSMLASSFIECAGKFNMDHIAKKHAEAYSTGQLKLYGAGGTTRKALKNLANGMHWSQSGIEGGAGNGIAMKIAPIGAVFATEIERSANSLEYCDYKEYVSEREDFYLNSVAKISKMTHLTRMGIASGLAQMGAILTCFDIGLNLESADNYFSKMIINAAKKGESYSINDGINDKLSERFKNLFQNNAYMNMTIDELLTATDGATCYAYNSLPFTYAMFMRNPSSIDTLFEVINAGGDTDSNGSMVGALLGAYNGTKIIPQYLLDGLWKREEVENVASQFCDALGL